MDPEMTKAIVFAAAITAIAVMFVLVIAACPRSPRGVERPADTFIVRCAHCDKLTVFEAETGRRAKVKPPQGGTGAVSPQQSARAT